jgi:hypothetical protein
MRLYDVALLVCVAATLSILIWNKWDNRGANELQEEEVQLLCRIADRQDQMINLLEEQPEVGMDPEIFEEMVAKTLGELDSSGDSYMLWAESLGKIPDRLLDDNGFYTNRGIIPEEEEDK